MKSPHFSLLPFLLVVLFSLSATTLAHSHEDFLHCLSLRSAKSDSISRVIYTQNNSSYSSILEASIQNHRFSTPATPKPSVIVTPLQISHIQATIYCSKKNGLQIRIRSGGHDFEGLSYVSEVPFVILDLLNFRAVEVDTKNKVAWVESGATIGELYYRIAEKSKTLAFPAGVCHTVGVGGHFSGGGYGILVRKYGLAADHVIDAHLIDVKGRIIDRKSMGEDLFWAIRGGGGNTFGIVLAWKVKLVSIPAVVTVFTVNRDLEQNATKIVHRWQYIGHKLPDDIFTDVTITKVNSSQEGKKTIQAAFKALFLGGVDKLIPLIQDRFPELGLVKENCIEMSWVESILYFGGVSTKSLDILLDRNALPKQIFKAKSDYLKEPIPESGFEGIWPKFFEKEAEVSLMMMEAFGGKMDAIPETELPYPHRAGNLYQASYLVGWSKEENAESQKYVSWIRRLYSYMATYVSKSPREAYYNYRDLDIGTNNNGYTSYAQASIWGRKYFKNNFNRLVHVKTMVDPENFFKNEQSIPPISPSQKKKGH
ncbi:cannabidiolic acid synthase-like 2 [Durio zibethinus]|uniref:Cannabidiolic acid synthase-like 2 n=1 Tax=Durio zibethinus TaxID=66656 RepID=A0A6P5Y2M9_DURZI|nr:cannabidiolic acid synthase-like 2 [Durio zibethinus]